MGGRVVFITGGSRGIGKAISLRFARAKARIFINFYQDRGAAEETMSEVTSLGAEAHLLQADLKDESQIRAMFKEVEGISGRVDVLVHNAASGVFRPTVDLAARHWDWAMNTNARALLLCAREAIPIMAEGGSIVAVSSIGAERVIPGYGSIGVSKAALESLTRYLAVEVAPRGITANAVSAGAVATQVWDLVPGGAEILAKVKSRTPSGRLVDADQLAEIVFFLAGPQARMIQGQVIVVDGGYSLLA